MSNVAKLKKRALDHEQKKQFDKALDTYMQVLGALGDHVEEGDVALFNRVGDLLLRQGNVGAAVDHYERAVDLYSEGGFHNNAIALCSKILRNAPGRTSVYYKLGRISAIKGFTSDAKTNFLEYADRMQRIGQVEEAFRALKEFADLCPDQDDIRLMLADQLVRADRKTEAIEQLELLYEKLVAEGRGQEAGATLDRIRAIDPSHQPNTVVSRPSPKANDLIFIDVGFDTPGPSVRNVTGSVPAIPAADAPSPPVRREEGLPPTTAEGAGGSSPDADDRPLPLIDLGGSDEFDVLPVDGLSTSAIFDAEPRAGAADDAGEPASHVEAGPVSGFEETALGDAETPANEVQPLQGIEQSTPLAASDAALDDDSHDDPTDILEDGARTAAASPSEIDLEGDDSTLLDISLDLIEDTVPEARNDLTFIFPDGETGEEWRRDPAADAYAPEPPAATGASDDAHDASFSTDLPEETEAQTASDDALRLEPLLQLPELDIPDALSEAGDDGPELPLISLDDAGQEDVLSPPPSDIDLADSVEDADLEGGESISELLFLDTGLDRELEFITEPELEEASTEAADGGEGLALGAEPVEPDLQSMVASNPDDWEARRRLGEKLLEDGDRSGGLAELEHAMSTVERTGDLRGATAIVNELIRMEPHSVAYHQKRVEYAVRSNDRSLLAEAYFSLAENLFQMGEIGKSRAVYARVLELSPGDARVRAALEAMNHDAADDVAVPEVILGAENADRTERAALPADRGERGPALNGSGAPAAPPAPPLGAADALGSARPLESSPAAELPMPRGRAAELDRALMGGDFVNLADWLDEDAPTRNTRMVVDVKEPEIEEQVDFAEMLAMFKQGVAANVDEADHEAHYDLGVAYKEMGLLDEAISEFQKALRGNGNRARTYEALGQCFVERGQYQIAVTILSRAIGDKSYTDDMLVGVLYLLGYASESLGRWADAQRFYERVFAVDIEFRDIGDRLAIAERGGK